MLLKINELQGLTCAKRRGQPHQNREDLQPSKQHGSIRNKFFALADITEGLGHYPQTRPQVVHAGCHGGKGGDLILSGHQH